jgi:hypothetical protein
MPDSFQPVHLTSSQVYRANLISVEDRPWDDCASAPEDALLAVCLFHRRRFCLIHRECHERNLPSVTNFFPLWSS